MANGIYKLSKQNYPFPSILTDDIKVVLTRGYTPNFSTDEFLSDIPEVSRVATSPNLTEKTFTLGVFDSENTSFTSVGTGDPCDFVVIYQDSGVPGTSRLLCALDTNVAGLPITPDGSNVNLTWATGGIFVI